MGPSLQELSHHFQGGTGSKEKVSSQKSGGQKNRRKETFIVQRG
jgi:hypothetical protein